MMFYNLFGNLLGGLRRFFGQQSGAPVAYSFPPAAPVTFDTAMQLSAVWACVKLLSETVASLPLRIYRVTEDGRAVDNTHPLALLFLRKPNRYQTRVEFFETVVLSLVLHGNAYCRIERRGAQIVSLTPLLPAQIRVVLLKNGALSYKYSRDNGIAVFGESAIWHLKLLGNGVIGMSPLDYQRNSLGIAQAAENAVAKIYQNGAKPSGVLKIERVLTAKQRAELHASFSALTTGGDSRLLVLEGSTDFQPISMSPQDIELLASRRFQIEDICRWYGVPSVMVNDTSGSTTWGSGIQQLVEGFYKLTLRPLLEKIEASIDANLIGLEGGSKYRAEFDVEALLRTDFKTRLESYRVGVQAGIITPNEARREEGRPDMDGGGMLYIQGATVPLTRAGARERFANGGTEFEGY